LHGIATEPLDVGAHILRVASERPEARQPHPDSLIVAQKVGCVGIQVAVAALQVVGDAMERVLGDDAEVRHAAALAHAGGRHVTAHGALGVPAPEPVDDARPVKDVVASQAVWVFLQLREADGAAQHGFDR
jgi:hypothetical protein